MLKIKLLKSKTPTASQQLELTPEIMINGECFIGRSRNCGIVLPSIEVSRAHASICCEGEQYYFSDLASLSGSRINDEVANINHKYPLKKDDIIRIGEFILKVEATAPTTQTAAKNGKVTLTQEVHSQTPNPTQQVIQTISIPQVSQLSAKPTCSSKKDIPIALLPPDQLNRWTKGELMVRCVGVIDETHDVKTFRFLAKEPVLFSYQPGQFVTLNLEINGKPVKRSYSISSTPSRPHTLEITVKRVPPPSDTPDAPPGLVSNWLHDNIKVGNEIKISGPLGKFTCGANPSPKLLMISAGSGITPMMSMSRWVLDTAADCDVVFFHCARSPRDIIFQRELELMSAQNSKFRLAIAITKPESGQAWWSFTGRLNEQMLHAIAPDFFERTVYVCGPDGFMKGVKTLMEQLGFPMQNYYEESFGGAKKAKQKPSSPAPSLTVAPPPATEPVTQTMPTAPTPGVSTLAPSPVQTSGSSCVVFAKSGKEVSCGGEDPILDVAELEGIEIESSCRSGVCGSCKVRKLAGEVKYEGEPDAIDESEQEAGYILTCIARPTGRVVIEA